MDQKLLSRMQLIEAREVVHRALMALPRTVSYGDVATAAGLSASAVSKFVHTPEGCEIWTVAAIGEAVEKLRAREGATNDH